MRYDTRICKIVNACEFPASSLYIERSELVEHGQLLLYVYNLLVVGTFVKKVTSVQKVIINGHSQAQLQHVIVLLD